MSSRAACKGLVSFRELVQAEYLDKGHTKEFAVSKILVQSGASRHSILAALAGTRVSAETARSLGMWALTVHFVDLDQLELMQAPERPSRRRSA